MNDFFIFALLAFFGLLFVSRWLGEKAMELLTGEEKAKLVDGFAGMRKYSLIPTIIIVVLLMVSTRLLPQFSLLLSLGCMVLYVALVIYMTTFTVRKLYALHLPQSYITKTVWSRVIRYIGIAILCIFLIMDIWQK